MVKKIENKKKRLNELSLNEKRAIYGGSCGGSCDCGNIGNDWDSKDMNFHEVYFIKLYPPLNG